MTKIRTKIRKSQHVSTSVPLRMLMLNHLGQIDVIEVNDLTPLLSDLRIHHEKMLLMTDLVNVCIIYGLARRVGLIPGLFLKGDEALCDYLLKSASDNILDEDKPLIIEELKASWHRLRSFAMIQRYIKLGVYRCVDSFFESPIFPGLGAIELFVQDYFCGLLRLLFKSNPTDPHLWLFIQWHQILFSAIKGCPYIDNPFFQAQQFQLFLNAVLPNVKQVDECFERWQEKLKSHFQGVLKEGFTDIVGWAKIELTNLDDEPLNPLQVALALTRLIQGETPFCEEAEIAVLLSELSKFLTEISEANPHFERLKAKALKGTSNEALIKAIKMAVLFAIYDYAHKNHITLFPLTETGEPPIYQWAGKSAAYEEKLLAYLLSEDAQSLQAFELYAIYEKAHLPVLRELAVRTIERRQEMEQLRPLLRGFGALSLASSAVIMRGDRSYMPQYQRLTQLMKGDNELRVPMGSSAFAMQAHPLMSSSSQAQSSSQHVPEEVVLSEALDLEDKSVGCALM